MRLKIPGFWTPQGMRPTTAVDVGDDGSVNWKGTVIGYVEKGTRTYSSPIHKGSRIVKYNKQVPEWHGRIHRGGRVVAREDSRLRVIEQLIELAARP